MYGFQNSPAWNVAAVTNQITSLGSSCAGVSSAISPPRASPPPPSSPQDQLAPKAEERPKGPVKRKERGRKDQRLSHLDTPLKIRPATPRGDRWRADNGPPGRGSLTSCPGHRRHPHCLLYLFCCSFLKFNILERSCLGCNHHHNQTSST